MKNKRKILISIIGIEFIVVSILNESGIHIDSLLGGVIGLALIFGPILFLLHTISKERNVSEKSRLILKILFIFIIICCLSGVGVKILGLNN